MPYRSIESSEVDNGELIAMVAVTASTSPSRSFDDGGRALPLTPEEIDQRATMALRALDLLDELGDENEQRETLAYLARVVDEDRLSDRSRFAS